jgi:hypothetical protein
VLLQAFMASYNFQTECRWDIKSMGIVLMLKWKTPLKYWGMLSSQRGQLGLRKAADIMVRGGVHKKMAGTKIIGRNLVQSTEEFKRGLLNCYYFYSMMPLAVAAPRCDPPPRNAVSHRLLKVRARLPCLASPLASPVASAAPPGSSPTAAKMT